MVSIEVAKVRIDGGTQPRASLNESVVAEYAEAMTEGAILPPVTLFHDGAVYWLADGFHRYHAHRAIGALKIDADVRAGTRRDAVLFCAGANAGHGLQRTNADKRRAVEILLADAEWTKWSDRDIAKACGVTHPFVASVRNPEVATKQKAAAKAKNEAKVESVTTSDPVESVTTRTEVESVTTPKVESVTTSVATPLEKHDESPGPVKAMKPAEPEDIESKRAELDEQSARMSEVLDQFAQLQAEVIEYGKIFDADDKLAEAQSCIKRQAAEILVLRSRLEGLMNEKNEAVSAAKSWRRKHDALEKRIRAEAA